MVVASVVLVVVLILVVVVAVDVDVVLVLVVSVVWLLVVLLLVVVVVVVVSGADDPSLHFLLHHTPSFPHAHLPISPAPPRHIRPLTHSLPTPSPPAPGFVHHLVQLVRHILSSLAHVEIFSFEYLYGQIWAPQPHNRKWAGCVWDTDRVGLCPG